MNKLEFRVVEKTSTNMQALLGLLSEYPENFIIGYFEDLVRADWVNSDIAFAFQNNTPVGTLMFDRNTNEFNWLAVKRGSGLPKSEIAKGLFEFFTQSISAETPVHFYVNTEDSTFSPVPKFTGKSFESARKFYRMIGLDIKQSNIIKDKYGPGAHVYKVEWIPSKLKAYDINNNIEVRESILYGRTLAAKRDFFKDELVLLVEGPVVTTPTIYTIPISRDKFIDPTLPEGNIVQYICHSCEPNLGVKDRTCFVALRDIKAWEEVRIDYSMIVYDYRDEMTQENRICKCGSPICRGKLGSYVDLPLEIREKYQGYISEAVLEQV